MPQAVAGTQDLGHRGGLETLADLGAELLGEDEVFDGGLGQLRP